MVSKKESARLSESALKIKSVSVAQLALKRGRQWRLTLATRILDGLVIHLGSVKADEESRDPARKRRSNAHSFSRCRAKTAGSEHFHASFGKNTAIRLV